MVILGRPKARQINFVKIHIPVRTFNRKKSQWIHMDLKTWLKHRMAYVYPRCWHSQRILSVVRPSLFSNPITSASFNRSVWYLLCMYTIILGKSRYNWKFMLQHLKVIHNFRKYVKIWFFFRFWAIFAKSCTLGLWNLVYRHIIVTFKCVYNMTLEPYFLAFLDPEKGRKRSKLRFFAILPKSFYCVIKTLGLQAYQGHFQVCVKKHGP